jgi:DNA polymerase-3 subunit beta
MKMAVEQAQLLKSLQMIEHAVSDRSAIPILANVLLETKGNELVLTATDLDVGIQYRLPLREKPEDGAVTIPARRLASIVRELPEEPIAIEARKNHAITLVCGTSQFRIPGLPPEDFPTLPSFEQTNHATLSQTTLKALLTHTAFAMSLEETRFILNGALLKIHDGTLTVVATDGRRLALASAQTGGGQGQSYAAVIPAKAVRELSRLLQEEESLVTIAPLKDNQLLFQFGEAVIITRLIEGQFPQYEGVIPAPTGTTLTCNQQLLASAIRRASLMTTAASSAVVFELAKERVVISKESAELGSAREEVPARYTGQPMTIAFNPEFWLDALKVLDVGEITIELSTPEKPAVVRLSNGTQAGLEQFLYLVLPMKLAA